MRERDCAPCVLYGTLPSSSTWMNLASVSGSACAGTAKAMMATGFAEVVVLQEIWVVASQD
jgi:hypothetical protein